MRKYLVIDEYTLPDKESRGFTKTSVVEADSATAAVLKGFGKVLFDDDSNDEWNRAFKENRLDKAVTGVYELVSGENELPAMFK